MTAHVVVAYLENNRKSWPAWKAATPDYRDQVNRMVDDIKEIFAPWQPEMVLNGHSGGGRFIFSYLDAHDEIPSDVVRIAFLDSNYGYEDTLYGPKIDKLAEVRQGTSISALWHTMTVW